MTDIIVICGEIIEFLMHWVRRYILIYNTPLNWLVKDKMNENKKKYLLLTLTYIILNIGLISKSNVIIAISLLFIALTLLILKRFGDISLNKLAILEIVFIGLIPMSYYISMNLENIKYRLIISIFNTIVLVGIILRHMIISKKARNKK